MPIKLGNKALYPKNWRSEIRPAILKRANNCCEFCGVPNYSFRCKLDHSYIVLPENVDPEDLDELNTDKESWSKIVLTIAHLDHDPTNNDFGNLKALCQKCHLNYDKDLHRYNSALTRRAKLPTKDMFL